MRKKKNFLTLLLFSLLIGLLGPVVQPSLWPVTEVQAKTILDTPKLSSVKAKNSSSITVKWKAVDDADGYRIYRKTADTEWKSIKTITSPKTLSYTNKNLMMGEKYYYTVSAYKLVNGKKKYGDYNTTGLSARTIIPATEKITVTATGNTTAQIEWTPVEGVDGYRVARRASDGEWTILTEVSGETNTSFSDSGLKTGRKYYYRIRPYKLVNQKQEWGKYDKSGVSVFTKMTTPKLVSIASPSSKTVTFTWKATPGVDGYLIYRKTNNGSWTKVKNIKNGNTTSYTEKSLAYNTLYHYTVKTYTIEEDAYHTSSRNKTGLKIVTKAASIKKVKAKEASASSIEITWPKLANVDGYRIYRGKTNGSFTKLADVSGENTLSYLDKTAKMGITYYYSVRGYKLVDDEKLLGYLNKNGVSASIAVPAPKMVSVTAVTYDSIQVTWKKVKYADSYALYRKVASSDEWSKIQTFKGNNILTYTDAGLKSSTEYSYAVKSIKKTENGNVYSKRSSGLSVQTPKFPYSFESNHVVILKNETRDLSLSNGTASTWSSSDPTVATVSNGAVTGHTAGKTTITAVVNGKKISCQVFVEDPTLPDKIIVPLDDTVLLTMNGTSEKVIWDVFIPVSEQNNPKLEATPVGNNSLLLRGLIPGAVIIDAKIEGHLASFSCQAGVKGSMKSEESSVVIHTGERANITIHTDYPITKIMAESSNSNIAGVYRHSDQDTLTTFHIYGRNPGTAIIRIYPKIFSDAPSDYLDYIDIPVTVLEKSTEKSGFDKIQDYLKRNGIFKNGIYTAYARPSSGNIELWYVSVGYEEKTDTFLFQYEITNEDKSIEKITLRLSPDQISEPTALAHYSYTSAAAKLTATAQINKATFNLKPATFQLTEAKSFSESEITTILNQASKTLNYAFQIWSRDLLSPLMNTPMKELGFPSYSIMN